MSNSLDSLYKKYMKTSSKVFSDDSDFSPLLNQVRGGKNTYSLFTRRLEKEIDLKWVDIIDSCIVPLDTILRNPRKFIVQEEEIVPIEKAKKINNESIRHLAQHTNMINKVEHGMVTPNRILNVFREESYDIYENRFIYTLLQNLRNFIEKRYNAIFAMAGDENVNVIKMESVVNTGSDEVTYSLKMNSKKSSKMTEVDDENDNVFSRIERIRKIIDEFCSSSFAAEMQDCVPVRPPITRTNVIQKDPNFVQCLDLWLFIESYDEVGYSITVDEKTEQLSQDYIDELNNLMAVNYLLLKKNSSDVFDLDTLKKRRVLKPKFVKKYIEETMKNFDISADEVKRIFVDEVSKVSNKEKQEEKKIEDAITRCLDLENQRKAAEIARIKAIEEKKAEIERRRIERAKAAELRRKEAERIKAEKQREKARLAKERERKAKAEALALERKRKAQAKAREKERLTREKAKERERLAREKAREQARIAKEKAKEKERLARQKALERSRIERELAKEKERQLKLKQKERERLAKEKAALKEKERIARQKAMERNRIERERAKEKERELKLKLKEKEKLAREKAALKEKERIAREKAKQKERARIAAEKAKLKEKERREKEKARMKLAKEKAKNKA